MPFGPTIRERQIAPTLEKVGKGFTSWINSVNIVSGSHGISTVAPPPPPHRPASSISAAQRPISLFTAFQSLGYARNSFREGTPLAFFMTPNSTDSFSAIENTMVEIVRARGRDFLNEFLRSRVYSYHLAFHHGRSQSIQDQKHQNKFTSALQSNPC